MEQSDTKEGREYLSTAEIVTEVKFAGSSTAPGRSYIYNGNEAHPVYLNMCGEWSDDMGEIYTNDWGKFFWTSRESAQGFLDSYMKRMGVTDAQRLAPAIVEARKARKELCPAAMDRAEELGIVFTGKLYAMAYDVAFEELDGTQDAIGRLSLIRRVR